MGKRKRIEELYYLRAISAMGILLIHASANFATYSQFGSKAMYLSIFLNQFFRFGSPIFMMVSGLVLFYNYPSMDEFNIKNFYLKKVRYILIPYILWSTIYFLYPKLISNSSLELFMLKDLGKKILLGEAYSHLYFIFLIFQFYLVLPLLIKYLTKFMKSKPIKVLLSFFVLQASILVYSYYFKIYKDTGFINIINRYHWKTMFSWSFYFITGAIVGLHYDRVVDFIEKNIKEILPPYIIITIFYVGHVYYTILNIGNRDMYSRFGSVRPHTMVYALFTMPILLWITRRMVGKYNILKDFGTYSLGIYFAHPLVLGEVSRNLRKYFPNFIGYSRLSSLILICVLGIIISFGLVVIIGMWENRWLLIGRVPKYRLKILSKKDYVPTGK